MKGIICAGGNGTRLAPLTDVINKHLLPVYDKPMIFYPLITLINSGIKEIMIVCNANYINSYKRLLGNGEKFGIKISFAIQEGSGGIAEAVGLCKTFVANDNVAVILGDNVFIDNFTDYFGSFRTGAGLFLKEVSDPERFGIADVVENKIVNIIEKPSNPKSNMAVTGLYLYDNSVFDVIEDQKYSDRNELEITDVNLAYVKAGNAFPIFLKNDWVDAGTFESLYKASTIARNAIINNNDLLRVHRGLVNKNSKSTTSTYITV
jgi:glucose-1-phosphate thymidylyltransferase